MKTLTGILTLFLFISCGSNSHTENGFLWEQHGKLVAREGSRIIHHEDGTPFLWLGCTAWGMTEWLTREEVDLYLDDRKSKGMNVVQLCLFWGKRVDYPTRFTINAKNAYGHKAFLENDSLPVVSQPALVAGGSLINPNDYWDHVDYCLKAIKERGMYAGVLPFWGRRYVNASHEGQSRRIFTSENIFGYGEFLGKRYASMPNIIWINGGDVKADEGGNFAPEFRLFAEGLVKGISGTRVNWNENSNIWDTVFMTYHPDGTPLVNSSQWFHKDAWLDFNMIETYIHRNKIVASIRQDLAKDPLKPTVLGEGHYEGETNGHTATAVHVRRQAYQAFFAGAAGFTYGGAFDKQGNGPLFSPSNNWKHLLNWEGAGQMIYLQKFLTDNNWWKWKAAPALIIKGRGEGELEKLIVKKDEKYFVYFPDNSSCILNIEKVKKAACYNTKTGKSLKGSTAEDNMFSPPKECEDAILILE